MPFKFLVRVPFHKISRFNWAVERFKIMKLNVLDSRNNWNRGNLDIFSLFYCFYCSNQTSLHNIFFLLDDKFPTLLFRIRNKFSNWLFSTIAINDNIVSYFIFRGKPVHLATNGEGESDTDEPSVIVQLSNRVMDGTRCRIGSLDMCIQGKCQVKFLFTNVKEWKLKDEKHFQ